MMQQEACGTNYVVLTEDMEIVSDRSVDLLPVCRKHRLKRDLLKTPRQIPYDLSRKWNLKTNKKND